MIELGLDARLMSAVSFVRQGAVFADIGTDHAYLPIFLLKSGVIKHAVCADVNKGPLSLAVSNARESGLDPSLFTFKLTDGALGMEREGITDYAICGMGGELIAHIIASAPHLHNTGIRLILQPMTKQAHLRRYLYEAGFCIVGEKYSFSEGKYYLTLAAEYCGKTRVISDTEAELGLMPESEDNPYAIGYFVGKRKSYTSALVGKKKAGLSYRHDELLLSAIEERIKKLKGREEL